MTAPSSSRRMLRIRSGLLKKKWKRKWTKSNKEIVEHIKKILGKNKETLEEEEQEKKQLSHPAHFGPRKYCLRECICEVEGQVPCPGLLPLPKELTGKYKAMLKASTQD
ncbi:28S ribosomal protein S25, mitochondrial [Vulpes lagopus]